MVDEQTRRDLLDNDLARVGRVAKATLGKGAEAYLHPRLGIVVTMGGNNHALSSRDLEAPDEHLSGVLADIFKQLQGRRS